MKTNNTLSIILASYFSEDRITLSFNKIKHLFDAEQIPFEFIIIDDGSKDKSFEIALELERLHENVKAFQLSRNYTQHYGAFAGLSVCHGACATVIDDDEQQPFNTLVEMYRLWEQGHKVIIPYRESRADPWKSKIFADLFYAIMNKYSDITFPKGGIDTFFIDRELIDIINERIHTINTATMIEVLRLGFDPYYLGYSRPLGVNGKKSRWTFKKKVKLAKDLFFSSSSFPIKLITYLGVSFSLLSIVIMAFYLYIKLFGNEPFWGLVVPGWTSIILFITFFGGLTMFSLGIIAEYIWRIYEEVKNRPGYIIKKK